MAVELIERPTRLAARAAAIILLLATCLFAFVFARVAFADPTFPELTGRVVDQANLLTASDKAQLETELEAFETKSTDQIVVVTVPSLQGYPIDEFGTMLGRKWGIGQKGKENGVLVIVATTERKVRIEVGRRLEPLLPDGRAGTIVRETILPAFRRGDFSGGIKGGVSRIKAVLEGDKAELEQRAKRPPPPVDYSGLIIPAIWILIVIFAIRAQRQQAAMLANMTPAQRRKYEQQQRLNRVPIIVPGGFGGWSGGSGGSSGGGGFSGGGGDFGGGGASGDW
jgi:uncharacterized protein